MTNRLNLFTNRSNARYNLPQESRDSFLSQKMPKRGTTTLERFVPFRGRGFCSELSPATESDRQLQRWPSRTPRAEVCANWYGRTHAHTRTHIHTHTYKRRLESYVKTETARKGRLSPQTNEEKKVCKTRAKRGEIS